jgi:hypothetical protein
MLADASTEEVTTSPLNSSICPARVTSIDDAVTRAVIERGL